jgi:hypothetical protein
MRVWGRKATEERVSRSPFLQPRKQTATGWQAPTRMPLTRTYADLRKELGHLGVEGQAVLEIGLPPSQIRVDGQLRGDAPAPKHPGIILSVTANIDGREVPMKWQCDHFTDWRDNLRAIALTLERLRLADLYGVAQRFEQYTGFAALPPALVTPPAMSLEDAARFVARESGGDRPGMADLVLRYPESFSACYKAAAKRHHPDAQPGNVATQDWQKLQEAAALLRKHHGL